MTARPIRYQRQVSDRKGKIFYTSITSLSHISKGTSYQTSAVSAWRIGHAFAALQRLLPANVYLQCCLTCQHGNFCPVGSNFNEIFCTKDLKISKKADLFFPTEDADERSRRQRAYCDCCPSFAPQVPDVFTYNDYLNALHP